MQLLVSVIQVLVLYNDYVQFHCYEYGEMVLRDHVTNNSFLIVDSLRDYCDDIIMTPARSTAVCTAQFASGTSKLCQRQYQVMHALQNSMDRVNLTFAPFPRSSFLASVNCHQ